MPPARLVQTSARAPAAPKLVAVTAVTPLSCAAAGSPRLRAEPAATFPTPGASEAPDCPDTACGLTIAPAVAARLAAAASALAASRGRRLACWYLRIAIRHLTQPPFLTHHPGHIQRHFIGYRRKTGLHAEIPHASLMGSPESRRVASRQPERKCVLSLAQIWDRRVADWHTHVTSASGFDKVRDRLLAIANPGTADACVDLGAGTGFVALALAPLVDSVLAVDISTVMAKSLAEHAAQARLENIRTEVADLRTFRMPAASTDLVVSSYALHHLRDEDKRALAAEAARWLRPGGRIVVADMMFGRGATRRDREILRDKVTALASRGPAGWWRIAKNLIRYGLGVGHEHPAAPQFWQLALRDAGFTDVRFEPVIAEAGIVSGTLRG
jgi:ubiquinone/menaquinone biosynthesis C-methylase UbiE